MAKKIKVLFLLFLVAITMMPMYVMAADSDTYQLIIELRNGEEPHVFELADKPVLTFEASTLQVSSSNVSFSYADVAKCYFKLKKEDKVVTDVKAPEFKEEIANKIVFNFEDRDLVTVRGMRDEVKVLVFAVNGMPQHVDVQRSSDQISIDLSTLPRGVFIIKVGNQTYKISR